MARLSINLSAIRNNYETLKSLVSEGCEVSAVIKANAYGLGFAPIAKTLKKAGCKTFFTATLPESIALREEIGGGSTIAMLNGYNPKQHDLYIKNQITPVLNDPKQVKAYAAKATLKSNHLPAIIHFDTGMNRLGMQYEDLNHEAVKALDIKAIMSHFTSSEDKHSASNQNQADAFEKIAQNYPRIPKSLSNSSGIFLCESYHYDLVRPGMAIYGCNPTPYQKNPMQSVIALDAEILQIHTVKKGETCGYNETYRFINDAVVAIVDIGYADGFLRKYSNTTNLYYNGIACPVRGNVSMDLTIIDLSNIPIDQMPQSGEMVEIIGPNQTVEDIAIHAETISYEILTSLSPRYERVIINP